MEGKVRTRNEMKAVLSMMQPSERLRKSQLICEHVQQLQQWKEASTIGITISMPHEVQTTELINRAWSLGKDVCVPKVERGTRKMTFYQLKQFDELEETFFGLREPIVTKCSKMDPWMINCLFVPGLAFAPTGYRLGYGGGYFDTYIHTFKGSTIALAFEEQIVTHLPIEPHDQPVDTLVTERGVLR